MRSSRLLVLAATGLAAGLAMVAYALVGGPQPPPQPSATGLSAVTAVPQAPSLQQRRLLGFSRPVRVELPRLGIRAAVRPVGVHRDGTVQVPRLSRAAEAGWYAGSAAPGQAGPTVILGHVDSARLPRGEAAFYSLGRARRGDRVTVTREDGVVVRFTVDAAVLVAKTRFPTRAVYGPTKAPALRLITCGGRYTKSGGYRGNIIVFAHPDFPLRPATRADHHKPAQAAGRPCHEVPDRRRGPDCVDRH
ncbi:MULTISPECIES: class F sortase [unclassified Streptomyces]|uniref:class F sortase n=1 Tax=unclassified Streptomyces TaxID=2593676 RepID=UPI00099725E5|nr:MULTISPECIES: class F sortase [unclassified Streptomyces]MYX38934.1 class F sortase [Streptomyces sp. SID8377]